MLFWTTLFTSFGLLAAANANQEISSKITLTVTFTEVFAVMPTVTATAKMVEARQDDGQWTPDATFLAPTPVAPVWTPQVSQPSQETPWYSPLASSTPTAAPNTPAGSGPDKGSFGYGTVLAIIGSMVGLGILGTMFLCYKRKAWCFGWGPLRQEKVADVEADAGTRPIPNIKVARPKSVVNPGAYPTHY